MAESLEGLSRCLACHEKDFELLLACNSNSHYLCLECLLAWLRSKTNDADSFDYRCPMHEECRSNFDPEMINDILLQCPDHCQHMTAENIQKISVKSALKNNKTVSCPKCPFFWTEDEDLVELFASCSACKTTFCVTCEHTLGPYGHLDHMCPLGASNKQRTAREVAEILTEASFFRCKNPNCEVSRSGTLMTKQEGDCNVVKCKSCNYFYCYICNKNLGMGNIAAHESFPHGNVLIPTAPQCWLFDEIKVNQTTEEALNLRKLHRLSEYFISLPISKKAKQILLAHCRDLLGDMCEMIVLEHKDSFAKCTII